MAKQQANLRSGSGSVPWPGGKSCGGGPGLTVTGRKRRETLLHTRISERDTM